MIEKRLYTHAEAAQILKKDEGTLRNLQRRHKIGYCKGKPITYLEEHLIEYIKSTEVRPCVVNQSLSSLPMTPGASNPPIGTSSTMTEAEVRVKLRAIESARKTMKRNYSSTPGASNGNGQQHESRIR